MSIYKDEAKGTWYCKFRYTDWQGDRKETTKRGFKTKREAKQYEENFIAEAKARPQITISKLIEAYMADAELRRRESSLSHIRANLKNHVEKHLGKRLICDIDVNVIRKWQQAIARKGLAPSTVRNINTDFAMILNFAMKHYNLPSNPFHKISKTGKIEKRADFWTIEELNKVLSVTDHPYYKLVMKLLFFSGLRIGEMFALTVNDMDFASNTLSISKTYIEVSHKVSDVKTPTSRRIISMPASIMQELNQFLGTYYEIPEHPLKYRSRLVVQNNIGKYADKAGVKKIVLHGLRHSHATYLIQQGVPITAISKRLGHSATSITLDTYSHVYKENDQQIAKLLENSVICGQTVVKSNL